MKIKAKQYAQALFLETRDKKGDDLLKTLDKFFEVLKVDNNLSQLEKIVFYFNNLWNKEYSLVEAEITCSRFLENDLRSDVVSYLKKISQAENIEIKEKEDKKVIGGFVLKYGDKIIDASIKNKINSFKNSLLN
ncbi:MAG: F0F1 ATP synthase subunit delta [Patescibacteria group bacterium]|jgi:F-type H+-transporting ATPase subunit delta|nr:F0F1 ATP synthase subunit delta [Patescibacteria group bacterium]